MELAGSNLEIERAFLALAIRIGNNMSRQVNKTVS
jgi:hypothetical protein